MSHPCATQAVSAPMRIREWKESLMARLPTRKTSALALSRLDRSTFIFSAAADNRLLRAESTRQLPFNTREAVEMLTPEAVAICRRPTFSTWESRLFILLSTFNRPPGARPVRSAMANCRIASRLLVNLEYFPQYRKLSH